MFEKYKKEQPIATKILENSILNNKLSHAYIFETNNYPLSYELILDFVKNIVCQNHSKDNHIEEECSICSQINSNNYIEFKTIDTEKLQLKKEELLKLQEEFKNKAIDGNKKIYLVKCAEKLNDASSNTILQFSNCSVIFPCSSVSQKPCENVKVIVSSPNSILFIWLS